MKYRNRSSHYLFTVTYTGNGTDSQSEIFFKALCKANREVGPGQLFRMGRKRDRSAITDRATRCRGHVPITICDRFDVYVRIKPDYSCIHNSTQGNWTILGENTKKRTRALIQSAGDLIAINWQIIEYCNEAHKDLFDKIFYPKTEIVSIPDTDENKIVFPKGITLTNQSNMKYEPKFNNWEVKLSAKVRCVGPGVVADVDRFFKGITGLSEVVLTEATPIDEHKDLPLVSFRYPPANKIGYSDVLAEERSIRVTKMDDTYLEGFDRQQFKKFRVDRIVGEIILVELSGKQN